MWYKEAKVEESIKKLVKRFPGNGIKVWIIKNPKKIFVSFGDWADDVGRFLKELKWEVGGSYKVEHDFEVGSPTPNKEKWEKVSSYLKPDSWGYWLDPVGKLIPCPRTHGHIHVLHSLGMKDYREAFDKGYIRLVTENNELFVNADGKKLNSGQIRTLNYMSKHYDFIKFVTDNDEGYDEFEDQRSFNKHIMGLKNKDTDEIKA